MTAHLLRAQSLHFNFFIDWFEKVFNTDDFVDAMESNDVFGYVVTVLGSIDWNLLVKWEIILWPVLNPMIYVLCFANHMIYVLCFALYIVVL